MPVRNTKGFTEHQSGAGFTLVEAMIALAVMMLFAAGIYGGIQLVFRVVYQSRVRILESAILNEQIEIVRNMSFFDVGIVNGSPAGLLARTVTTTRNNIDFIITRTIRNIDDPFDGTIDAEPLTPPDGKVYICHSGATLSVSVNALGGHLGHGDTEGPCDGDPEAGNVDQAPADYKMVHIDVICSNCSQQDPLSATTLVGPKFLEGNPDNGALFVEVINSSGQPVQGATVRFVATSTDPTYDFEDTTDNDGMVRIVDLEAGQNVYHISVTKDGYTTDGTTTTVENATKPPASVVAQDVTSRTFVIDQLSELSVNTTNALCGPIGNVGVTLRGSRLTGTEPDTYLVNKSVSTDGVGAYQTQLPWDTYTLNIAGYDLLGSIPMLPVEVLPGESMSLQLIVGANTAHSLLVHVEDSATGDAISSSTVTINAGADQSAITGIGTLRQLDWSGGAGQSMYSIATQYAADDGNITASGDIELTDIAGSYPASGWLESSTFDLGGPANFVELDWSPVSQPAGAGTSSVRLQFASSNSSTPASWDFRGPDGTATSYYTDMDQTLSGVHNGDRYARYRLLLSTASSTLTPTVSDIAFTYVAACTPPGQVYFGSLSNTTYDITVSASGYTAYVSDVVVNGDTRLIVPLVAE